MQIANNCPHREHRGSEQRLGFLCVLWDDTDTTQRALRERFRIRVAAMRITNQTELRGAHKLQGTPVKAGGAKLPPVVNAPAQPSIPLRCSERNTAKPTAEEWGGVCVCV